MTATQRPDERTRIEAAIRHATQAGHLDAVTGTGRHAKPRTCPTCRARVLVGDDNHLAALTTTIDPTPALLPDEALAMALGRKTYQVRTNGGRIEISIRKSPRFMPAPISAYSDNPEYTIHLEHTCRWKARIARRNRATARNGASA